jgi:hypothetical protein
MPADMTIGQVQGLFEQLDYLKLKLVTLGTINSKAIADFIIVDTTQRIKQKEKNINKIELLPTAN